MTSPPREIVIECPHCHTEYRTWWRASMNFSLDNFSAEYVERMSTGTCPNCAMVVELESLVVEADGTWRAP